LTLLRDRRAPNRPLTQLLDNILKTARRNGSFSHDFNFSGGKKISKVFPPREKLDKA
jgi:hypothetical protein